ncbi:hypothetical protein L1887_57102 [Cichorium endivia]|nr:hypothetical protein L1887_57102 [Cichorium endivia]
MAAQPCRDNEPCGRKAAKEGEWLARRPAQVCVRREEEALHDTSLVTPSGISTVGRRMTAFPDRLRSPIHDLGTKAGESPTAPQRGSQAWALHSCMQSYCSRARPAPHAGPNLEQGPTATAVAAPDHAHSTKGSKSR